MKRIAILKYEESDAYEDMDDYYHMKEFIAQHITDWTEVSDEDFEYLRYNRQYRPKTLLIEYPIEQQPLIGKTVEDIKKQIADAQKKQKEKEQKYKEAIEKAKATKLAKKAAKVKKEFEALQKQGLV